MSMSGPARLTSGVIHPTIRPLVAPTARILPVVILLGLTATALEGLGIGLLIPLLNPQAGLGGTGGFLPGLLARFAQMFPGEYRGFAIGGVIFGLVILKNVAAYGSSTIQAWIYGQSGHILRENMARRLVGANTRFLMLQPPSRLINAIAQESWRAADAVQSLLSLAVSLSAMMIFVLFLFLLSPFLAAVTLLGLALIQLLIGSLTRRLRPMSEVMLSTNQVLANRMLHLVTAWRLIRLYSRQGYETQRFAGSSGAVRDSLFRVKRRQQLLGPLSEVLYFALFFMVATLAWMQSIPFAVLTAFVVLLYRLQPQVRMAQSALADMRGWSGSLDEVGWLLGAEPASLPPRGVNLPGRLQDRMRFENVSFAYDGESAAIRNLNLEIRAGSSVAIIGRSGSGKSTIAALLCGLVEPDRGRITIDGIDLAGVNWRDWLDHVSVVGSELELIEGTVAENIVYGRPDADRRMIEEAADAADATRFINELPEGFETRIGSRGQNLSAGQRQRIALARALIRDPDVLILDEATNALDILSESAILSTLEKSRGRRTIVIISHHLSVIQTCDEYLLVDNGDVVSGGSTRNIDIDELARLYQEPDKPAAG